MNAVTDEQVLARLVESEEGRRAASAIIREQQAERIKWQSQAVELRKECGKATAELNAAVEATGAKLEQARQAMRHAEQEYMLARQKLSSVVAGFEARINKAEAKVRQSAPSAIDDTLKWLADQGDEVRAMEIQRKGHKTNKFHPSSGEAVRDWHSTAASQQARLTAIRAAIEECRRLKTMVMDESDLASRLDELRDGLPEVAMQFEGRR